MKLYGRENLTESMRTVRKNTIQIAEDIPEESYGYRPTPDSRSVAEILLHIAAVWQITYQLHEVERRSSLSDFDFEGFFKGPWMTETENFSKQQIIELLQTEGERLSDWIERLPDSVLIETVQMPEGFHPERKTRFEMLVGAKEHEMHHRAQLMVAQRLLGIVPHLSRNRRTTPPEAATRAAEAVPAATT
jgi:uncharacterized damage-inducible protein DinB